MQEEANPGEVLAEEEQEPQVNICDISWSHDGTVVTAGINKTVIVLDMSKILCEEAGELGGGNPGKSVAAEGKQLCR